MAGCRAAFRHPRIVPLLYRLPAGLLGARLLICVAACWPGHANSSETAAHRPAALELNVPAAFHFVALGDTRFHDPLDAQPSNAAVREAMVAAVDRLQPSFISIGGDIVYDGENFRDWEVWDSETTLWRSHGIPVYPAIGNHELRGNERAGLTNYFNRFPQIDGSRYYSVRTGNCLMLVLDSSFDETAGPQGEWLKRELDGLPPAVDFVFLVLHHPPYTSSKMSYFHVGHGVRSAEGALAKMLEARQAQMHARIIVFAGHVHNYERFERGGVTYFVTGGGGAHPYIVKRAPNDLYKDPGVNYHYLLVEVTPGQVVITMNKLEFRGEKPVWTEPDSVSVPANQSTAVRSPER